MEKLSCIYIYSSINFITHPSPLSLYKIKSTVGYRLVVLSFVCPYHKNTEVVNDCLLDEKKPRRIDLHVICRLV